MRGGGTTSAADRELENTMFYARRVPHQPRRGGQGVGCVGCVGDDLFSDVTVSDTWQIGSHTEYGGRRPLVSVHAKMRHNGRKVLVYIVYALVL